MLKKMFALVLAFLFSASAAGPAVAKETLGQDLMGKVMEQDLKGVPALLKKGADVNLQDKNGAKKQANSLPGPAGCLILNGGAF